MRCTSRVKPEGDPLLVEVDPDEAAGQHQPPGRGIDQQRAAAAEVAGPVASAELVADQPVGGLRIGDPQQRLGQAHQHHALGRAETILVQERLDPEAVAAGLANPLREVAGVGLHATAPGIVERRLLEEQCGASSLVGAIGLADRGPQRVGIEGRTIVENGHAHTAMLPPAGIDHAPRRPSREPTLGTRCPKSPIAPCSTPIACPRVAQAPQAGAATEPAHPAAACSATAPRPRYATLPARRAAPIRSSAT